jgi:hypothetical protein
VPQRGVTLAPVKANHRRDPEVAADGGGFIEVCRPAQHLTDRVAPAAGFEQDLAQQAVRLRRAEGRAYLAGEPTSLACEGECPLILVEAGERDRLVEEQEQPQVDERRLAVSDGKPSVKESDRLRVPRAAHRRQTRRAQRPAHGPGVGRLFARRQCLGRDLGGHLEFSVVAVRARGKDKQAGPVPDREAGRRQGLAQRREEVGGPAGEHAALYERAQ